MAAAVHHGFQAHARLAAHVERADAFRAVGLVGGEGHQVDLQLLQVDIHLAGGLGGVDVEEDAAGTGQLADGGDVVDGADFVVHVHDRHQDGVLTQGSLDHGRGDQAVFARLQVGDLEAFALQLAGGVQHRLVLDLRGDDVLALAVVEVRHALDGEVVGFGCTGSPDDFTRVGVDQFCHLTTCVFHRFFSFPAEHVGARGRVAEVAIHQQALAHLLSDARVHRRSGGIVEVNRQFHRGSPIRYRGQSRAGALLNLWRTLQSYRDAASCHCFHSGVDPAAERPPGPHAG
ncbi:hypothetical protein D9M68_432390 [compost metagenome]